MGRPKIRDNEYKKIYWRDRQRKIRKENPEKEKILQLKSRINFKKKIIEKLGGKCIICGITDWRILQVNHINGNGRKERMIYHNNSRKIHNEIVSGKREGDFDLRCANCNILYEYETGRRKDERYII